MKGYRIFIFVFVTLLVLYIIGQLNRPKDFDWSVTLRNDDKNPYGAYILYNQVKQLFPSASLQSHREPAYNVLDKNDYYNSAYIIVAPEIDMGKADLESLLHYAEEGNSVFLSAFDFSKTLMDSLGLKSTETTDLMSTDSVLINFTNPALKAKQDYHFKRGVINAYFKEVNKKDSSTVLGINQYNNPNFVKVQYGKGAFYIHAAPLCFSNYFMLFQNNSDYVAKALSYLPADINSVLWDEYYKAGREGPTTPLRFFLSNEYLTWALRLTIIALIVYVLFAMKRRQRIIPVIPPLRNTTLDFVETVSGVYFSQHDNNSIAQKKIQHWLDFVRQKYYLATQNLDDAFTKQLQKKSGVPEELIRLIIKNIGRANAQPRLTDDVFLELNNTIDKFYQLSKI